MVFLKAWLHRVKKLELYLNGFWYLPGEPGSGLGQILGLGLGLGLGITLYLS